MTKDIDNIKRVVADIRYLIATDCCNETIQARIENYITEKQGQTLPIDRTCKCCNKKQRMNIHLKYVDFNGL
tara:strand:- start:346 stop:561 length:216 start_codon:yes stop_codon:yes gene_type:complete